VWVQICFPVVRGVFVYPGRCREVGPDARRWLVWESCAVSFVCGIHVLGRIHGLWLGTMGEGPGRGDKNAISPGMCVRGSQCTEGGLRVGLPWVTWFDDGSFFFCAEYPFGTAPWLGGVPWVAGWVMPTCAPAVWLFRSVQLCSASLCIPLWGCACLWVGLDVWGYVASLG